MMPSVAIPLVLLLQLVSATPFGVGEGPIALSLQALTVTSTEKRDILQRDLPSDGLADNQNLFLAEVGIGTPPQRLSVAVDTGSYNTWVNPNCNNAGISYSEVCNQLGRYNPAASNPPPTRFPDIDGTDTYGDGSKTTRRGYKDVWTWANNTKVPSVPFAVADTSSRSYVGLMGLGPDTKDGFDAGFSKFSLVNTMLDQGIIRSRTFAMGFTGSNQRGGQAGSIVFGGVDRNSYTGNFFKVPILPKDEGVPYNGRNAWRYWIQTTVIKNNRPDGKSGVAFNTTGFSSKYLLDTGTTAMYIASEIARPLIADMPNGGQLASEYFPCKINGSIEFVFARGSVKVPYGAFGLPIDDGATVCTKTLLTAGNATSDGNVFGILGLGFLKAAYAVFDWDNKAVYLAQGASCGPRDLVAVAAGSDTVTSIKGNCK